MSDDFIVCTKISIDCVENDPVDIKCGGPEYLGFDFFVKEEQTDEFKKFIVMSLNELEIPLLSIYCGEKRKLNEKDIWTKERIIKSLKSNADEIQKEAKRNHKLLIKK